MEHTVVIDGMHLTLESVVDVARCGGKVELDKTVRRRIEKSRAYVENAVDQVLDPSVSAAVRKNRLIYGVTTGFGCHKEFIIKNRDEANQLQKNILMSHACGTGPLLDPEVVRAVMLLRLQSFAMGHSGVRPELLDMIVELLNQRIHPLVPEQGSVGSSGDLCPLSHAALVLIGRGRASADRMSDDGRWERGPEWTGMQALESIKPALARKGLSVPFELSTKEGLALTNGATVMTAIGILACQDAFNAVRHADIAGAMTLEAVGGRTRAFDPKVHSARPFEGQKQSAENVRRLISGSALTDQNGDVHDAYSVRCIPQVHGAVRDALDYVRKVLDIEICSATDNPLFFEPDPPPADGVVEKWDYSAGNFHGEPVALAMDFLGLALAEIGSISERRTQKLLDKYHNYGLPSNLAPDPRIHSGLMMVHYTAASLVSENKVLCHPASCDSIPTSSNIEDHVSMGTVAARKARTILENVENVIAIELLCAAQAIDFRTGRLPGLKDGVFKGKPGKGIQAAHRIIRTNGIVELNHDREPWPDILAMKRLVESGQILKAAEKETGELH
jgi:histidine ammonia-lyase